MNELALFAGIGGGLLGTGLLGWTPICAVEKEPYCREVLLRRQRDGMLPMFPIWDDIRTFDGRPWRGIVDVVTAGFPCQPFSGSGKRKGEFDDRNLWPETIRVIREVRPRFCLLENVPNLLRPFRRPKRPAYFGTVLADLAASGFDARWQIVSAAFVGACHLRERIWILASDTDQKRWAERIERRKNRLPQTLDLSAIFPDSDHEMLELIRSDNGISHRRDRIAALGNAQVPAVVRAAWRLLTQ